MSLPASSQNNKRILIVDGSAVDRGAIATALEAKPALTIVATAATGTHAIQAAKRYKPDVIVLDIETPEFNGVLTLPELFRHVPDARIILTSPASQENAAVVMKAMELGAAAYTPKSPSLKGGGCGTDFYDALYRQVMDMHLIADASQQELRNTPPYSSGGAMRVVCFGASTGGPHALMQLFTTFKGHKFTVPIIVVVHLPEAFADVQVRHLSQVSGLPGFVAEEGMKLENGHIYVAPGGKHLKIIRPTGIDSTPFFHLSNDAPVNFCKPAVDITFASLAESYGNGVVAVVLTGMGQDGAHGAKQLFDKGARIFVQERSSCVVWGMPKSVLDLRVPAHEESLKAIAEALIALEGRR